MKVLVTGSDGFIGSHLVESLVKDGFQVKAFCFYNSNNSWGWLDNIPAEVKGSIEVVLGDIRDPYCVHNAMKGCDVVFCFFYVYVLRFKIICCCLNSLFLYFLSLGPMGPRGKRNRKFVLD